MGAELREVCLQRDGMYEDGAELREVDKGQAELGRAVEWQRERGVKIRTPTTNDSDNGDAFRAPIHRQGLTARRR